MRKEELMKFNQIGLPQRLNLFPVSSSKKKQTRRCWVQGGQRSFRKMAVKLQDSLHIVVLNLSDPHGFEADPPK